MKNILCSLITVFFAVGLFAQPGAIKMGKFLWIFWKIIEGVQGCFWVVVNMLKKDQGCLLGKKESIGLMI